MNQGTILVNSTVVSALFCAVLSSTTQAQDYPQNPILRPLTLPASTLELSVGYSYGKQHDDSKEISFGGNIAYGLTDNLQIGLDGISYRLLNNQSLGFELMVNGGVRGYFDSDNELFGDSTGLGIGMLAKQIITDDLALTFGANYTHWNNDDLDNTYELDYAIGVLVNITDHVTLSANYLLRDLKDFQQGHANAAKLGLNYAYSSNLDLGLTLNYSDFAEQVNGYAFQQTPEKSASIHATWRF